jgi:outer membrane protein assembly factor BamA
LQATLDHYLAKGFLETGFPHEETRTGAGLITLTFNVDEGIQYRMGELRVEGKGEATEILRRNWELRSGEPYDYWYLEKFLAKNRELFPEGFDNDRDVLWLRDCSDNTINVTIELDPRRQWKPKPQDKPCEDGKDKPDKDKKGE